MYSSSSNPFFADEDGDDDDGVSPDRPKKTGGTPGRLEEGGDRRQQIFGQIDESESRQLESTRRALASIYDSERMGIATAEELVRQGEQLDNIQQKTSSITKNMKISQKHINSIKSVFGGIKNWWSGENTVKEQEVEKPDRLKDTLEGHKAAAPHPGLRIRSLDTSGFYEEEDDLDSKFLAGRKDVSATRQCQILQPLTRSEKEKHIDTNLDLMSDGMSRLKGLALGLGDEISMQNKQLDDINASVDIADSLLEKQNRQMRKILHK